jgi:hypothetical protein
MEEVTTPPSNPNWFEQRRGFLIKLAAGIIGLTAIIVLAIYQTRSSPQSSAQIWSKLQTYTACSPGPAISFQKPTAFNSSTLSTNKAMFSAGQNKPGATTQGIIIAACTSSKPLPTAAYLAKLDHALLHTSDKGRGPYVWPVYKFVLDNTSFNYIPTLGPAVRFSNSAIKSNAWQISLAWKRSPSASASLPAQKQGTVIALAGQKSWYYLMLAATTANWQANQSTWNQILNSIKIDQ